MVLTQCFSKKNAQEMRKVIETESLDVKQIVPVLAQDYEINEEYTAKAFVLDILIQVMAEALPDELMDTLQNLQKVSLKEKQKRTQTTVVAATTAAVAARAASKPIADCAVLIPTQVTMIASVAVIFGIDVSKTALAASSPALLD